MSKEELLTTEFDSACDAMTALADFLRTLDLSSKDGETRGNYQNLRVVGNQIFD